MDKKTAQRLIHRHLHETQAVPWINEIASQRAFPFSAAFLQFVLSEGTDRETINKLCYGLTALLGGVAARLEKVTTILVTKTAIDAIVQLSVELLTVEQYISFPETLTTALVDQLSDWGEEGPANALAGLFGEALTVVAQTLNCVNNHEAWKEPQVVGLLEACTQAVNEPQSEWQVAVMRAQNDSTWGQDLQDIAKQVLDPETRPHHWSELSFHVSTLSRQKCCQCYEPGSIRHSCGEYAGRYCDEHWKTAGFRPADDQVDYLDAGEHRTEEEAY